MNDELKMSVSPICTKDGKKYAFVSFTDGSRTAEGKIPDCKIIKSEGFSEDEVRQLEGYMNQELAQIKKMAAGINIIHSFMGD